MLLLAGLLLFHSGEDGGDVLLGGIGVDKTKSRDCLVVAVSAPFGRCDEGKPGLVVPIRPICVVFGRPTEAPKQNTR